MVVDALVLVAGLLVGGSLRQSQAAEGTIIPLTVKAGMKIKQGDLLWRVDLELARAGRTIVVPIEAGRRVEKGEILFRLPLLDKKSAGDREKQAKAALEKATKEYQDAKDRFQEAAARLLVAQARAALRYSRRFENLENLEKLAEATKRP